MLELPARSDLRRRLLQLFPGLAACGVGLALMVRARLGLGPWDVLHQGLATRTGLPIGTLVILVGFAVLLAWVPLRQRMGVGTLCNVVLIGLVIDAVLAVVPTPAALVTRWAFLLAGVMLMGIGSGLYIGAGLGPGPRDGVMTGLAARGYSLRLVRTVIELSALAAGWILGGTVGAGTLIFALGIGPLVQLFLGRMTIPAPVPPSNPKGPPVDAGGRREADEVGPNGCRQEAVEHRWRSGYAGRHRFNQFAEEAPLPRARGRVRRGSSASEGERDYVPTVHDARYSSCAGVSRSRSTPMVSSLSRAISWSMSMGTS